MSRELPSGEVTFAFVDVVHSTRTFTEHGELFVSALDRLLTVVRELTAEHGGVVVKTEGDGAFLVFADASSAVRMLVEAQRRVETPGGADDADGGGGLWLRMRAGAHRGPARPVGDDYVALAVNVAARVAGVAQAGQVLVSRAVVEGLDEPDLVALVGEPVGDFALKDVPGPSTLWRACGDEALPRAPAYRPTNVADPVTTFVGRSAELGILRELVAAHRLVTVLGPGGMGKTRLTSELLLLDAKRYPGGAWIAELAAVEDPDGVLGHVAAAVRSTARTVADLVTDLATRGPMVVLLDNCEHVVGAVADLAGALLAGCPELRVLATSREALRVGQERVWRIPPLDGNEARIELFTSRVWTSGGRLEDTEHVTGEVVELCERLDGMPLAIELAAAQAAEVPMSVLLGLVAQGTDPLARHGQDRQSSLDALVAWSLDRLPPDRQQALLVLSVAPGRLPADDAIQLLTLAAPDAATPPVVLLRDLTRASLIDLDGGDYRLLETIRAAARRRLRNDSVLADRARSALAELAIALVTPYRRGEDSDFVHQCTADRQLLLEQVAVQEWEGDRHGVGDVWMAISDLALLTPMGPALVATAARAIHTARSAMPHDIERLTRLGPALTIASMTGDADWSASEVGRLVDSARATDDDYCIWCCLHHACNYSMQILDDLAERADWIDLASRAGHRLGAAPFMVSALTWEANHHFFRGDYAACVALQTRIIRICRTMHARELEIPAYVVGLAEALTNAGRVAEALDQVQGCLNTHPTRLYRLMLQVELARALRALDRHSDAQLIAHSVLDELDPDRSGPDRQLRDRLLSAVPELADSHLTS